MAAFDQPVTTYSDTTPQKRVITDVISLIDPSDAPAIDALGGLDGASGKFRFVNEQGTNPEWLEDTLGALTDTMAASTTSTGTSLTVTDGSNFQVGHIIRIDSEDIWVSAVSTNTLTVTRNFGGTAATHSSTDTITIIGMARLEGAESTSIGLTDRTSNSNYTQILHKEIKVTLQALGGANAKRLLQDMKANPKQKYMKAGKGGEYFTQKEAEDLGSAFLLVEREDDFCATAYWYMDKPENSLPELPPVKERIVNLPK